MLAICCKWPMKVVTAAIRISLACSTCGSRHRILVGRQQFDAGCRQSILCLLLCSRLLGILASLFTRFDRDRNRLL